MQDKNRIKIQRDARPNQGQKLSQTTTGTDNIYSHKIVCIIFIVLVSSDFCCKTLYICSKIHDEFSLPKVKII